MAGARRSAGNRAGSAALEAPVCAVRAVLDDDAGGREGVADGVRGGPVLAGPGPGAGRELRFDEDAEGGGALFVHGGPRGVAETKDTQHVRDAEQGLPGGVE